MQMILVGILLLVGTILNEAPLIVGLVKTGQNMQFLGVIHHAQDYFYYLSQFAMGREHWFFGFDPLTSEYRGLTLVGWPNIFLGRLFALLGIDHLYAYQASVFLLTLLFLFLAYKIARKLFRSSTLTIFALFLFVFTNGLPHINLTSSGFQFSIEDFWFNLGNPLTRLGGVPHQLLTNIVILIIFYRFLVRDESQSIFTLTLVALSALTLASLNPIQWVLLCLVLLFMWTIESKSITIVSLKRKSFLFFAIVALAGFPMALYLKHLFSSPPYNQLAGWESGQLGSPTLSQFVFTYGLVGILGVFGTLLALPRELSSMNIVFVYGIVSFLLYLSPVARFFHLSNARFISSVTVLALSYSTTTLVRFIGDKIKHTKVLIVLLAVVLSVAFIPEFYFELKDKTRYFTLDNGYFYLPQGVVDVFTKASVVSSEKDMFLVIWPYDVSFAGLTGRREYNGHPLLTIESDKKDALAQQFFSESPEWQQQFLKNNGVTYVITYPWSFPLARSFLREVYKNQSLVLYSVIY